MILRHPTASELRRTLKGQGPDLGDRATALVAGHVTDDSEIARVVGTVMR